MEATLTLVSKSGELLLFPENNLDEVCPNLFIDGEAYGFSKLVHCSLPPPSLVEEYGFLRTEDLVVGNVYNCCVIHKPVSYKNEVESLQVFFLEVLESEEDREREILKKFSKK